MLYSLIKNVPYCKKSSAHKTHELCQLTIKTAEELLSHFREQSPLCEDRSTMPLFIRTSNAPIGYFDIHTDPDPDSDTKKP